MAELEGIIDYLKELLDDNTIPRNVRNKISTVIEILEDNQMEESIKVNKALDEFEEISNDANLQPYTRTQLWNVVSMLENA